MSFWSGPHAAWVRLVASKEARGEDGAPARQSAAWQLLSMTACTRMVVEYRVDGEHHSCEMCKRPLIESLLLCGEAWKRA